MSFPFYKITCSYCDFNDSYIFGTQYIYEGQSDHEPILQEAWCSDCDKILHACAPFTQDHAQSKLDELNMSINTNKAGLFSRFIKSKKHEVLKATAEINIINMRLLYFKNNPYKPRCLHCGGYSVYPIDFPYGQYEKIENLNIKHLCGGQLLVSMEGRISFTSRSKVVYDESGIKIRAFNAALSG